MSPDMFGSSPSTTGVWSEARSIMTYDDDDEEKDYVCFKTFFPFMYLLNSLHKSPWLHFDY